MNNSNKRPPIVVVVGHIDHGKSSLLDALRGVDKRKEAGGITQHIGAYEIEVESEGKDRKLTFIDTPGHEAFTAMRKSGVKVSDIALLVIASDDGYENQTEEAKNALEEAKIPYIVVFTKSDIESKNIEKVKQVVLEKGILLEKFGGDIPWIEVSSKTGENMKELVDLILLTSDLYSKDKKEENLVVVIESGIDPKAGIFGTIIVKNGSLKKGDFVIAGKSISPVRFMEDDRGEKIDGVMPSTPVKITGFDLIPKAGQVVDVFKNKKEAEEFRKGTIEEKKKSKMDVEDKSAISLLIKADTYGGLIALREQLEKISSKSKNIKIIQEGVGDIVESDVDFASINNNAKIIGFHNSVDSKATKALMKSGTEVKIFDTIYSLIEWVEDISKERSKVSKRETATGKAKIIRIFEEQKNMTICGAEILEGGFIKNQAIEVLRGEKEIGLFKLHRIEQNSKEVESVEGDKTQFAMQLTGSDKIELQDDIIGFEKEI